MPTLDWIGKNKVVNHHLEVPVYTLNRVYSFDENGQQEADNGSDNMIIHGDNLVALKALLPKYEGKIDCIYIDPPYNTGNQNEQWVYNDNVNDPVIMKWLGKTVGQEGEDLSRHDKWLCMMYPRLTLLHKLLSETGTIFISIDDNEQMNLRMICDEIFGINNYEGHIHWRRRNNQPNDKTKLIGLVAEHILVYSKNKEKHKEYGIGKVEVTGKFSNPDNDPRGAWATKPWKSGSMQSGCKYRIVSPTGKIFDEEWLGDEETYNSLLLDGRIIFPKNGNGSPRKKYYKSEREEEGQCATNWWTNELFGCNQDATTELKNIFGGNSPFNNPKPTKLIQSIIELGCISSNALILDSFSGSATTAHSVLKANKEDGGNRKFILVELGDYADTITAERVKRVIKGYGEGKNAVEGTGGSFSFYELGEPIIREGKINRNILTHDVKQYIYYCETKQEYIENNEDPDLLGVFSGCAYYFFYDPANKTTLNRRKLKEIKTKAESYVIYADKCTFSGEELKQYNITFKKIPSDIPQV